MLPDQLLIISVAAAVLVIVIAYGFGYHHGRVDGFQDGRISHPAVSGTIPDTTRTWVKPEPTTPRPYPAPGSPFALPPDVPSNPAYDEKGIKPDWP